MAGNEQPENLATTYPSVDLAYDIAIDSYDVAVKRIEWIDGRLQALLTFAATVGGAVLSVVASRGLLHFRSVWFYLAMISFTLATIIGFYARFTGTIRVLDPTLFYENWLPFLAMGVQEEPHLLCWRRLRLEH